jgi:tetratricopeptide (TPR) repeat protein
VTSIGNETSEFLEDVPLEIRDLLDWYGAGRPQTPPSQEMSEFASYFLGAMHEDGALIPMDIAVSAPHMLGLILFHHRRSPGDTGAWLNLGLALRRMTIHRADVPREVKQRRLQLALKAFTRSMELDPGNVGKNIRVFIGEAFTFHQLGLYEDEVRCCVSAVEADSSDPRLWLFYGFALKAAGRKDEALSIMDKAFEAYLLAGEPAELDHVFAGVKTVFRPHRGTCRKHV